MASKGSGATLNASFVAHDEARLTPLWVIAGLAMGPAVALGLARFAYALLLPAMRLDLGWSFADAGAMNTANAAGYLAGALVAAPLGRRVGDKVLFNSGLFLTAVGISLSGMTASFSVLMLLRALAGLTGAIAFIAGAGLVSAAAAGGTSSRAPTLLGVYFAGAGLGVVASAITVPSLLVVRSWQAGWLVLGALAFIAALIGFLASRQSPQSIYNAQARKGGWSPRFMAFILSGYGLFGAGYIAYATFIVAYLRSEQGFGNQQITLFWTVLGLASIAAAFAWGPVLARLKGGRGAAATIAVVTIGAMLPLLVQGNVGAYASAILFGGSFLAVIAAVTSFARKVAEPQAWTSAIAALTIAFGLGQCIGPVLSGAFSDGPSGIRAGLWLSVAILVAATVIATLQPERKS